MPETATPADVLPLTGVSVRKVDIRDDNAVDGLAEVHPMPLAQTDLLAVSRKPVAIYAAADAGLARLCETKRKQCEDLDMKEEVSE